MLSKVFLTYYGTFWFYVCSEAEKEPLLASMMHSSILSHDSLENAISFHMANLLASSSMTSTQIQSMFLNVFEKSPEFRQSVRQDIEAVKLRDPAVKSLTDVMLYFKGFHAIQAHRVAHWLWNNNKATIGKISFVLVIRMLIACFS